MTATVTEHIREHALRQCGYAEDPWHDLFVYFYRHVMLPTISALNAEIPAKVCRMRQEFEQRKAQEAS